MRTLIRPWPTPRLAGQAMPERSPGSWLAAVDDPRFLSRDACHAAADRFFAKAIGGGTTSLFIESQWTGNIRWARNVVTSGGDTRGSEFNLTRTVHGASGDARTNSVDDRMLERCVRRAEEVVRLNREDPEQYPETPPVTLPCSSPTIWFDATYAVDAAARGQLAAARIAQASQVGVWSAGYVETSASGVAVLNTDGLFRYYPFTTSQYSLTVRDPQHGGSGWAGVDFNDWRRIDTEQLTATALDKCIRSRNPVAIEPGRYTAILEPQAVCDLFAPILDRAMERLPAESGVGPFAAGGGNSKIGQRVLDPRLTVSADPMDPDCGFVPFDSNGEPYLKTNWIEDGVLKALSYERWYGLRTLNHDAALPNSRAFRLSASGATATLDEMIATTVRGVLVTRFSDIKVLDLNSMLMQGYTRDGLWLIEHGKISKAVKNFRFTESPLFAFNNVEQVGASQRVFRPDAPAVVPPIKVKDFSFTALMDAV